MANREFRGIRKEENKEKARVRKNMIMHRCSITFSMVIHDLIFMCHCRYRTLSDWYEAGNHENRPREKHRIELRRVWQLRYEKEHRKEKARKDDIILLHIQFVDGVTHRIHRMRKVRLDVEFLESIVEPESTVLRCSLATKFEMKN